MTKYAITGVTGKFGRTALKTLTELVPATDIVALARNTTKAQASVPAGVEVRRGDYTNVAELTASLQGVDKLLFISSQPGADVSREQQHKNVIDAAKAAGVATVSLAADHTFTEQYITAAGLQHSFLRNNWYLENEVGTLNAAANGEAFVYSAAEGQVGWALEREYAEAAARVLASSDAQAVYEFAGPARTYADLAAAIDGDFTVLAVSDAEYDAGLQSAGLDAGTAALVTSFQTLIRAGALAEHTTDLPDVLGHALTPIKAAIKEARAH